MLIEGRRPFLPLDSGFPPSSSPHRTSTFQRIRRSNPGWCLPFSHSTFLLGSDSILLSHRVFKCPESLDPFALYRPFSDSLGGRDATDYYGSAAPWKILAAYLPTFRNLLKVPALLAE